jgi:predicted ester cyclase
MSVLTRAGLPDDDPELIEPLCVFVDAGLDDRRARHMVRVARLLYTFWHTGEVRFLNLAVDPTFVDNTLPRGRPQGPSGPVTASAGFRVAVPDLTCELSELLIVCDRIAVRLRFRGHFSGTMNGIAGRGQEIDFVAFDIQHVGEDKITEDWHLEDNLTFLQQAELVTIISASV